MLAPTQAYQPYRLSTGNTVVTNLEDLLLVENVFLAKLRLANKSPIAQIQVVLQETEDLGLSAEPLFTGLFTTTIFDVMLDPGQIHWYAFDVPFLTTTRTSKPVLQHVLRITNLNANPTINDVFTFTLCGVYEETQQLSPANPLTIF